MESQPGIGTKFIITLPKQFNYSQKNMSKTKVLYVEDELFLGKIVKESLESRGFEVIMESDGAKATDALKKSKPDICVLDVMLPNKDGFAIADEIREHE